MIILKKITITFYETTGSINERTSKKYLSNLNGPDIFSGIDSKDDEDAHVRVKRISTYPQQVITFFTF